LITNNGNGDWEPSVNIEVDNGILTECGDPGIIGTGDFGTVMCTIILPSTQQPGSQPKATLSLSGDGITREDIISLYVKEIKAVSWIDSKTPVLQVDEETTVEIRIRNDGNIALSHRLLIDDKPSGWTISIDGSGLIQIEPGQEQTVRLSIIANSAGSDDITLSLSDASEVDGEKHSVVLKAEGQSVSDQASSGSGVLVWGSLVVMIIGIGAISVILIQRKQTKHSSSVDLRLASAAAQTTPSVVQQTTPAPAAAPPAEAFVQQAAAAAQCWACMKSIEPGPCLACPACGARYHGHEHGCGSSAMTNCRGCQAPSSTFILS